MGYPTAPPEGNCEICDGPVHSALNDEGHKVWLHYGYLTQIPDHYAKVKEDGLVSR